MSIVVSSMPVSGDSSEKNDILFRFFILPESNIIVPINHNNPPSCHQHFEGFSSSLKSRGMSLAWLLRHEENGCRRQQELKKIGMASLTV
jgi:hypothetical protein